jgi:hypothetical protein
MTKRIRQNLKFRIVSTTLLVWEHLVLSSNIGLEICSHTYDSLYFGFLVT